MSIWLIFGLFAYSLLFTSLISIWSDITIKIFPIWQPIIAIAVFFLILSGQIEFLGLVWLTLVIIFFLGSTEVYEFRGFTIFCRVVLLALLAGLGFVNNFLPGFNPLIFLSDYNLIIHFNIILTGLIILGLNTKPIKTIKEIKQALKSTWFLLILGPVVIFSIGLFTKTLFWKPSIPNENLIFWLMVQILFLSVAQEAVFRGYIQKYLTESFKPWIGGTTIAISISACLFGLSFYQQGSEIVAFATICAVLYGYIYALSERIELAILSNFIMNIAIIFLFQSSF